MKKITHTRAFKPIIVSLLYLFLLLAGVLVNLIYNIRIQQGPLLKGIGEDLAREYFLNDNKDINKLLASDTGVIFYDTDGNFLSYFISDVPFPGTDTISVNRYVEKVLNGKTVYHSVLIFERFDLMAIIGFPVIEDGNVIGIVFIMRNLKNLPESIVVFMCYFTFFYWLSIFFILSSLKKNKELTRMRQADIDNMTHALKTPIASVKALTELIRDDAETSPDEQKEYCNMIMQEMDRQSQTVQDILTLSSLQNNSHRFVCNRTNASEILLPLFENYVSRFEAAGIDLHIEEDLSSLPALYTNKESVTQIFEILLDNALKYTAPGGNVWFSAEYISRRVGFCIRDDGVGIKPEALPHIFERFYKGNPSFGDSGNGLGLAIASELAAGLKEKIWCESNYGEGSAFYFTVRPFK